MNNDQFAALSKVTRARPGSLTNEAARMHLVEGVSVPEVARRMAQKWGRSSQEIYPIVFNVCKKALIAKKLCEKVAGIEN